MKIRRNRSRLIVYLLALTFVLRAVSIVYAQPTPLPQQKDDGIDGVVVDNTITLTGHNFFAQFVTTWQDLEQPSRQNLTIRERPSARWGSLIWVEYNHRVLYRIFLQPGRPSNRAVAEGAATHVARALQEMETQQWLFTDPDLAKDEM
jgi:curli production assembly/transport component CsgE